MDRMNPSTNTRAQCAECGSDAAPHRIKYVIALVESICAPAFTFPLRWLNNYRTRLAPKSTSLFIRMSTLLERYSFGTFLDEPDDKILLLDQVLWEEAKKYNILMREFRLFGRSQDTFIATLPDGRMIDFEGIPLPRHEKVWWINNKSVLKKKFKALGFPIAQGGAVATLRGARKLFSTLKKPVIVKPAIGSASRHTTLHISTRTELDRAFLSAHQISPFVVIEQEILGDVYRPTVVDGKLIATLRCDQPYVIGDGEHSVEELITTANLHPARQGPYFSQIKISDATINELTYQGLTLQSVPQQEQRVKLHQKINWSVGGTTADVTDDVHPDNRKLFEDIAQALKAPVVGIDFITRDIGRSWQEGDCGVIECNDMPYFDNHHLPFEGTPRNVASTIWNLVA